MAYLWKMMWRKASTEEFRTYSQNLQSELEGKIDEKFNQILKILDTRKDDLRQNYSRGRNNFRGRWHETSKRGEYSKKYYPNRGGQIGEYKREDYSKGQRPEYKKVKANK